MSVPLHVRCPACGREVEAHSSLDAEGQRVPEPGDFSACFYCCAALVFTADGLRVAEAVPDEVRVVQRQVRAFRIMQN